jgi:adenylate cyclase
MALEIERKFRLKDVSILKGMEGEDMYQAYLAQGPVTVRVRISREQAWLTLKGPSSGATRLECEYAIPLADAQQMTSLKGVFSLSKTRFRIEYEGHVFEVDQYKGPLEGLFTVEAELQSADERLAIPNWVGEELTGRRGWDNDMLAKNGPPEDAFLYQRTPVAP